MGHGHGKKKARRDESPEEQPPFHVEPPRLRNNRNLRTGPRVPTTGAEGHQFYGHQEGNFAIPVPEGTGTIEARCGPPDLIANPPPEPTQGVKGNYYIGKHAGGNDIAKTSQSWDHENNRRNHPKFSLSPTPLHDATSSSSSYHSPTPGPAPQFTPTPPKPNYGSLERYAPQPSQPTPLHDATSSSYHSPTPGPAPQFTPTPPRPNYGSLERYAPQPSQPSLRSDRVSGTMSGNDVVFNGEYYPASDLQQSTLNDPGSGPPIANPYATLQATGWLPSGLSDTGVVPASGSASENPDNPSSEFWGETSSWAGGQSQNADSGWYDNEGNFHLYTENDGWYDNEGNFYLFGSEAVGEAAETNAPSGSSSGHHKHKDKGKGKRVKDPSSGESGHSALSHRPKHGDKGKDVKGKGRKR